ncbi:MAG: IS200/IS605 family transposase, partial [Candidatus Micrarchaeales archaeon]
MFSNRRETMDLVSGTHIKYQLVYHLQWVPKYRFKIFWNEVYRYDYDTIVRITARRHNIGIIELTVMPDHVHAVVSIPPTMSVSRAAQLLKGASSYEFMNLHPEMRKRYQKGHLF